MDHFPITGVPDTGDTADAGEFRAHDPRAANLFGDPTGYWGPAVGLKFKLGFDDSLDVVGVQMIGGLIGTLLVGLMATPEAPAAVKGLFCAGGFERLRRQAVGAFTVPAYSPVVTTILALIVKHTIGLRLNEEDEVSGIDEAEHAETGYDLAVAGGASVHDRHGAKE